MSQRIVLGLLMTVALSGCFDGSGANTGTGSTNGASAANGVQTTATPISLQGVPPSSVTAGGKYDFRPTVSSASGVVVTFSISGRPAWAAFDGSTGELTGTPAAGDAGLTGDITITASNGSSTGSVGPFTIRVNPEAVAPTPTAPPVISGTPAIAVVAGVAYDFVPSATDPSGGTLTYSVQNLPTWATFSATTGQLSGTPAAANVGTFSNIVISVSDGTNSAALPAFSIAVTQIANGSATLSWVPPTQNTDGSALTDLSGYRIYYGTSSTSLTQSVQITNPGLATYVLSNLSPGTWYFSVVAYASVGTQSSPSAVASKTIG